MAENGSNPRGDLAPSLVLGPYGAPDPQDDPHLGWLSSRVAAAACDAVYDLPYGGVLDPGHDDRSVTKLAGERERLRTAATEQNLNVLSGTKIGRASCRERV